MNIRSLTTYVIDKDREPNFASKFSPITYDLYVHFCQPPNMWADDSNVWVA